MSFLKAEWRKLAIANYSIDPELLTKYLPAKTELDIWEGKCYVSLVGFMFLNTKMLGVGFPFHRDFEEANLRFYVRHKADGEWKRGVVFIKEIVPKPILAFIANSLYREHYQSMKMSHDWSTEGKDLRISYTWGQGQSLRLIADSTPTGIESGTEEEFITEHYWGYTRISSRKTFEYEVTHPRWEHYKVKEYHIDVDFGKLYGAEFEFLDQQIPSSVMLAEGSEITVENKRNV